MFSIFDSSRKTGVWVKLNETGHGFAVTRYDDAHDTVTIEQAGRSFLLVLRAAKIASADGSLAFSPMDSARGGFFGGGAAAPDEARRQEAVSNEVSRRLAVRAQAGAPARQL